MTKVAEEKNREIDQLLYQHQQEIAMIQGELQNQESKVANYEKLLRKIRSDKSRERDRTKEREKAAIQKTQKIEKAVSQSIAKALRRSAQR